MAKQFPSISDDLKKFIEAQKIFFVGSADVDGRVNISPKGSDSLRVMGPNKVLWLNLTGSGNETAAHMLANNRITIMFCSFEKEPMILRLYGSGKILHETDKEWNELNSLFGERGGARQIFDIDIDLVQTSCGFQVPYYEFQGERNTLDNWVEKQTRDDIRQYWQQKNKTTIDGKPTDIQ